MYSECVGVVFGVWSVFVVCVLLYILFFLLCIQSVLGVIASLRDQCVFVCVLMCAECF